LRLRFRDEGCERGGVDALGRRVADDEAFANDGLGGRGRGARRGGRRIRAARRARRGEREGDDAGSANVAIEVMAK
jgi:hypothetical protein